MNFISLCLVALIHTSASQDYIWEEATDWNYVPRYSVEDLQTLTPELRISNDIDIDICKASKLFTILDPIE